MKRKFIQNIDTGITLYQYNEIPVIEVEHAVGSAKIALQGAHLLSWKPNGAQHDVLWLSEIEPFKAGNAIRGGIPVCFPWFNNAGTPAHGYARIRLWQLRSHQIMPDSVQLIFTLNNEKNLPVATLDMTFAADCRLTFTNTGEKNAQIALHSYFNVSDIRRIVLLNLPDSAYNSLTQQQENVPTPRTVGENVDCIYRAESGATVIDDPIYQRQIEVEHQNAGDIVLWNPWHKATGNMSETGYQTMVCVETARIRRRINRESVGVIIRVK
ncbi:D-hexose-6-phosphate mutarotase [Actinobacillus succinogenes]|uniref:Putative glucose-6-phosphate 1-epimerase n=1 Tax=Actinobacillus succinogenes (strain ATCC 55618 / DSM 22257 / CCUG 43843 / 130Z) TaxID=339671 RepID=A6VNC5_ACTSZ|nr:D-hexose-6-phosphate mutarotase [Actinobacillus succinogenes]ABR74472.1 Aldose 1-epimerase [Actinobacillus succinogenes 130Z]PHI41282.1 D-hexose-6-phosphate mutarotase [Actinobacillus succinogenes]